VRATIHPYLSQYDLEKFCEPHGIKLTAYMPLACGNKELLEDPVLVEIAKSKGATVAQVILKWLGQRGIVIIPKSTSQKRLGDNLQFESLCSDLTEEEMIKINVLDRGYHVASDPNKIA